MTGDQTSMPGVAPNGALGPLWSEIVARAARGDLESQRKLFSDRVSALQRLDPSDANGILVSMDAIAFGRLVASHGEAQDFRRLAGALLYASGIFRSSGRGEAGDYLMAETLSVLEQLAEVGDDIAAMASEALISKESPELMERVRGLRLKAVGSEGNS